MVFFFSTINIVDRALLTQRGSIKGKEKKQENLGGNSLKTSNPSQEEEEEEGVLFEKMSWHEKFMGWMDMFMHTHTKREERFDK